MELPISDMESDAISAPQMKIIFSNLNSAIFYEDSLQLSSNIFVIILFTPGKSIRFWRQNSKMEYFDENCVTLRMASFCFQIVLQGSFDRFLSIFFKKNKILEKIMIFVYQNGVWVLVVSEKSIKSIKNPVFSYLRELT